MSTLTKTNVPTESPAACHECGCPSFWRSAYGGPLRCAVCEPWPTVAMVGERWAVYRAACGAFAWMPVLRAGERPAAIPGASLLPTSDVIGDEDLRWEHVEDEDGSWLVIYATCRSAAKWHGRTERWPSGS